MEEQIFKSLFDVVIDDEIKKLVGTVMKRFEISEDKEVIKSQTKELIYEWGRNLKGIIKTGKVIFDITNQLKSKE